jgi:hypothetical protein
MPLISDHEVIDSDVYYSNLQKLEKAQKRIKRLEDFLVHLKNYEDNGEVPLYLFKRMNRILGEEW